MMNYLKETGDYYSLGMNNVILIFSGIVSDANGRFDATKVYYPVRFTNILKTRDGFSYEEKGSIIGWSTFDDSSTGTKGYVNPLQFYTDVIEENRDNYDSEVGDGFEIYQVPNQIAGLADINDDLRNKLYERAMGIVTDYYMNHHYTGSSMDNLTVSGEYLLMFKNPGSDYKANNKYFVICSAYISCSAFEPATVYYPVEFDGIVSFSNGVSVISKSAGIQGYSHFVDNDPIWEFSAEGYIDGNQMFDEIVTANRDNYIYEVSDELKRFGE